MLHEVDAVYDNHYEQRQPQPDDQVLSFHGDTLLMKRTGDDVELPRFAQCGVEASGLTFLFKLGECGYYLVRPDRNLLAGSLHDGIDAGQVDAEAQAGFSYEPVGIYRWMRPRETRFAVEVASQLAGWYHDNAFCGRCGQPTQPDGNERMLRCAACGNTIYPRINPGVIVGVTDGDHMLLTKYAGRGFTNWALVAGFTEIGESLEQTVAREVLEETGVHVKNIRYFSNQPWPRSSSLLVGFFADLDGSRQVSLDDQELACAEWVHWSEVPHDPDNYSLTRTMMCTFHDQQAALQGQEG